MSDKFLIIETENRRIANALADINEVQIIEAQSFDSSIVQQIIIPVTAIIATPLFSLIQQAVKGHTVKVRFDDIEVEGDYEEVVKLLELIREAEKNDNKS